MAVEPTRIPSPEERDEDRTNDRVLDRDRATRWIVFVLCMAGIVLVPALIIFTIIGWIGFVIGLAVGVKVAFWLSPRFVIQVPQAQAFVTIDDLHTLLGREGDANVVYGPGTHISFPWESRSEKGNLSIEIITLPFSDEVPGKDTRLSVRGSMQFHVDLECAWRFIGIDQSTIQGGIVDLIKSTVSSELAVMTADVAKAQIQSLNNKLYLEFGLGPSTDVPAEEPREPSVTQGQVSNLEHRYAIKVIKVTIAEIDLPDRVQKTRDALDQAAQVFKGVAAILGMTEDVLRTKLDDGSISVEMYNEAVDRFFVQSGVSDMKVTAFKFNNMQDLGRAIGQFLGRGK